MLISIIVPVYNSAMYLSHCLQSLVQQTYSTIEIILIDDGSTDTSLSICQRFASSDSRIIVCHQHNQGVSSARNHGLKIATGEYIMFVDSDDYTSPSLCESLIEAISSTSYQTAFCGYYYVSSKDNSPLQPIPVLPACNNINNQEFFIKQYGKLLNKKILLSLWAKLFSASIIKHNHITFDTSKHIGEDLLFLQDYIQALSKVQIAIINQPLYYYNIGMNNSLSSKFDLSRIQSSKELFYSMKNFCYKMNMIKEGMPYTSIYYFRSCSIALFQLLYFSVDDLCVAESNKLAESILHCPATKQALCFLKKTSPEGLYYAVSYRMPLNILKMFIRLRQMFIRILRRL